MLVRYQLLFKQYLSASFQASSDWFKLGKEEEAEMRFRGGRPYLGFLLSASSSWPHLKDEAPPLCLSDISDA